MTQLVVMETSVIQTGTKPTHLSGKSSWHPRQCCQQGHWSARRGFADAVGIPFKTPEQIFGYAPHAVHAGLARSCWQLS